MISSDILVGNGASGSSPTDEIIHRFNSELFGSDAEIISFILEESVKLSNSHIGFFHLINEDQKTLRLVTWSKETLENCTASFDEHYPIESAGIWVNSFFSRRIEIFNNYSEYENKKGLPDGHFPLFRFFTVPVIFQNQVIAIVGAGNKYYDYFEYEVELVNELLGRLTQVIYSIRTKKDLQSKENEIRELYYAFDFLQDYIIICDNFGNLEYLNNKFTDTLNISKEDYLYKNLMHLANKLYNFSDAREILYRLNLKETWVGEYSFNDKFGNLRYFKTRISPLKFKDAASSKIMISSEDITGMIIAKNEIELTNKNLSVLNEAYYALLNSENESELLYEFSSIITKYFEVDLCIIGKFLNVGVDSVNIQIQAFSSNELMKDLEFNSFIIKHNEIVNKLNFSKESIIEILNISDSNSIFEAIRTPNYQKIQLIQVSSSKFQNRLIINVFKNNYSFDIPATRILNELIERLVFGINLHYERKEKKRIEEILEIEKNQLIGNLNSISDGIIAINQHGYISYFNTAVLRILDKEIYEIFGKNIFNIMKFYDENDELIQFNPFDEIMDEVKQFSNTRQYSYYTHKGDKKYFKIECNKILSNNNMFEGIVIIIKDVTNLHKIEMQLALSQKMEAIGQLAAGIAHEINTPMQFIGDNITFINKSISYFEMYIGELEKIIYDNCHNHDLCDKIGEYKQLFDIDYYKSEIPKALDSTNLGIERVIKIIKAMRNFSHSSGKLKSYVNINRCIEDTVTITKNEWKNLSEIILSLGEELPEIFCSPDELNQVFLNMIINSVHAIEEKIKNDANHHGKILIKSKLLNNFVEITIEDNGCGISESKLSRIFEPFYTTKELGKGTGQGLTIAHDIIVNKHHGEINVESQLGEGARFKIKLPVKNNFE